MIVSRSLSTQGGSGSEMQDIPPQGSIADIFFPRLIARLHRDGFEGAVRFVLADTTKILYLKGGEIASAASNAEADRLASILIQEGRLTLPQLEMAASRLQPGGSLGKTLIEMGFLSPSELLQGARRQVRQILGSCCTLSSGSYQIEAGPLPPQVTVLGLSTRRLVIDAVLQAKDRQWVVREMGSMESVYRPTETLLLGLADLKLDPEIDQVARMLDGSQTLRDLSGRTSLDDFTVSKLVLALDVLGMAEKVGEAEGVGIAAPVGRAIPIESDAAQADPETILLDGDESDAAARKLEEVFREPGGAVEASGPDIGSGGPAPSAIGAAPEVARIGEPDPPAIPGEELPAFASPPGEEEGAQWQIDPKTGERVHLGPIEVTFEGRVGSGGAGRRNLQRIFIATGAGAAVLLAVTLYLGRRSAPAVPTGDSPPARATQVTEAQTRAEGAAAPAVGRETPSIPAKPPAPEANAAPPETKTEVRPAQPARTAPAVPPQVVAPQVVAPRTDSPHAPPAPATPPPVAPSPAAPPPGEGRGPAATPHGSVSPFGDAARYLAALRQLDAGDPTGAAQAFRELALAVDPGRFTIQLMIACEAETLQTVRAHSGERGSVYVLPYTLKDRSCYRVCWGNYPTKEAAGAAIAELPPPFAAAGVHPAVVSFGRFRPRAS